MKKSSKSIFVTFVFAAFLSFNAVSYASKGACYIRVQYGPAIPDPDQQSEMAQTYCYQAYTREQCYEQARSGDYPGIVLYVNVLAWKEGESCKNIDF